MQVYLDNAATTQMREEVIGSIIETMRHHYGNASSTYALGRLSKSLIENARKTIARLLHVSASEIIFTSGGTEADNLILRSAVRDLGVTHIVTTKIEHHAVLHTLEQLAEEYRLKINYLSVDTNGDINFLELEAFLKENKNALVSLMHINNEIGNILNIERVAQLCKSHNALFHTDAVQSVGHYAINLNDIGLDFLAASAHKFHGPKGVGFAFIKKRKGLKPLIFGGEQERGLRAGTESVHNIVGMEKAMCLAYENLDTETQYIKTLKTYFIQQLKYNIPHIRFNGHSGNLEKSTYTLLNVLLPVSPKKSPMILFQLDLKGIACSKGSACQSGSNQKSHVLTEIQEPMDLEQPSLRFSLSIYNTFEDINYVVNILKELIEK